MQLCRGGWVRLSQPPSLPCGTLFRWCALGSEVAREGCVCYFQSETGSPYLFCALCFRAGRKPKRSLEDCRKNCLLFVFDFPKLCQSLAYTRNSVIVKLLITELPKPSLECLWGWSSGTTEPWELVTQRKARSQSWKCGCSTVQRPSLSVLLGPCLCPQCLTDAKIPLAES